mgnify:CR=1 FL=1
MLELLGLMIVISTVFAALQGTAPSYLSELCRVDQIGGRRCTLRSAQGDAINRLQLPLRRNRTGYGDRAFSSAGPSCWNALPLELRTETKVGSFRKLLKTYLFERSFGT